MCERANVALHIVPDMQRVTERVCACACLWNFGGLLYTCRCPAGAVEDAVQTLLPGQQSSGVGAWSSAIGNAFLQPYGLNADASTFTANGTAGGVHQAVNSLPRDVAVYRYNPETGNRCEVTRSMLGERVDMRSWE